ncbi:MAG: Bax inhibitor-1/YccA family protein [Holosporaceae bacterium]|jgi:FtsH-binding integral membrane protein|nr:Bax inhibitor-1/YccA family protein [Holosporaceae bacterium]
MKEKVTPFYKDAVNAVDAGLRKYMLNVFSYMSSGLALTAVVAYLVSCSDAMMAFLFYNKAVSIIVALIPLGISLYLVNKLSSISAENAKALFLAYAGCLGLSLASIFVVYSAVSIASTFFVTSSMFLSMVIYGYVTEKDLTSLGSFLIMGVIGLMISSIVNIFMQSSTLSFIISAIGVVIFTGLTAYDTQTIKSYYFESDTVEISEKKAIFGAFRLYLDFINLFMSILRFMGTRRD